MTIDDGFAPMADGVSFTVNPGETITLPDGRMAIVVGIPDALYGAPEPPPVKPPLHRDIWCFCQEGLVLSQTSYLSNPEVPADVAPDQSHGPQRYVLTDPHTWGCEEHKPA